MEVYFDNSATTKVSDGVAEIVMKTMLQDYGNPSSKHKKGFDAEQYIKNAKNIIAGTLKVSEKEIIFTSGGTESNNLAILGVAHAYERGGKHIITTSIEHASVISALDYLEEEGFEITYLPVDKNGHIDLEVLKSSIRKDTILISFILVNNEIGTIQNLEQVISAIKSINIETKIHVDAVQAYGKYKIFPKKQGIDLLSVSGHKIHAPKGIGFLYIKEKTKIKPIIFGGNQQNGIRSGTENLPGIAGIGEACLESYKQLDAKIIKMTELKDYMISELEKIDGVFINSQKGSDGAPHIVSASFEGIKSEVLLHALEDKNIYVSSGSACSTHKNEKSSVLVSVGIKKELLDSTIRFSFCEWNTLDEVEYTLKTIKEMLPKLKLYKHY